MRGGECRCEIYSRLGRVFNNLRQSLTSNAFHSFTSNSSSFASPYNATIRCAAFEICLASTQYNTDTSSTRTMINHDHTRVAQLRESTKNEILGVRFVPFANPDRTQREGFLVFEVACPPHEKNRLDPQYENPAALPGQHGMHATTSCSMPLARHRK